MRSAVLYAYCELTAGHVRNFQYFVCNGMQCTDTHYVIIVNGAAKEAMPDGGPHVTIVRRENVGFDFGAWAAGLAELRLAEYGRFVFVNGSCCGPFLPPETSVTAWIDIFCSRLRGNVHCVGPTINIYKQWPRCKPHVQTYAWAVTSECLHFLLDSGVFAIIGCTKDAVIAQQEVGTSTAILERGWDIGCFVPEFDAIQSYQASNEAQLRSFNPCADRHLGDMMYPAPLCFGRELQPVELMFIKTNRGHTSFESLLHRTQLHSKSAAHAAPSSSPSDMNPELFQCSFIYGSGAQNVNVTDAVHALLKRGVHDITVSNALFGDPHVGTVKHMTVLHGGVVVQRVPEGHLLQLKFLNLERFEEPLHPTSIPAQAFDL